MIIDKILVITLILFNICKPVKYSYCLYKITTTCRYVKISFLPNESPTTAILDTNLDGVRFILGVTDFTIRWQIFPSFIPLSYAFLLIQNFGLAYGCLFDILLSIYHVHFYLFLFLRTLWWSSLSVVPLSIFNLVVSKHEPRLMFVVNTSSEHSYSNVFPLLLFPKFWSLSILFGIEINWPSRSTDHDTFNLIWLNNYVYTPWFVFEITINNNIYINRLFTVVSE